MSKTYSTTIEITEEKEYSVTISAGLALSEWITAGSTTDYPLNPSSYADFAALEADEEAIRQLMLVHNAVDYLAQATAGDSLMQSVINSDVCAKWINLSDYALDTLYANSDIADEMDTADKYFYGEWGIIDSTTTPPTWGALGNVPIMTANNAPYGEASASSYYLATNNNHPAYGAFRFDNVGKDDISNADNCGWLSAPSDRSTPWLQFKFVNPVCVKKIKLHTYYQDYQMGMFNILGSNDGNTFTPIANGLVTTNTSSYTVLKDCPIDEFDIDNDEYYLYYRIQRDANGRSGYYIPALQFYGRELKPLVPTMTSNTTPKGEAFGTSRDTRFGDYYSVFAPVASPTTDTGLYFGDSPTYPVYVGYKATDNRNVGMIRIRTRYTGGAAGYLIVVKNFTLQGSDDGFASDVHDIQNFENSVLDKANFDLMFSVTTSNVYKDYRLKITEGGGSNNRVWIQQLQFYGSDYSEKEFAQGSTRKTIYDHGVELATLNPVTDQSTLESDHISVKVGSSSSGNQFGGVYTDASIDFSNYTNMRVHIGQKMYGSGTGSIFQLQIKTGKTSYNDGRVGYAGCAMSDANLPYNFTYNFGTTIQQSAYACICMGNANMYVDITEWWLE